MVGEPLVVEVLRGDLVEARHRVHAVAVRDGRVELALGDPDLRAYLRSSAKPIQVLPVVRACPELDDEQIALCCASHLGRPEQIAVVERTLALAGASADDLECGPDGIHHTCSGKHAGFLALCAVRGWPFAGYRLPDHPCQRAMRAEVAATTGTTGDALAEGVDGCGIPTQAVALRAAAEAYVELRSLDGADRVLRAMRTHPELLRGPVAADAVVMRALDGWIAKGGAEGLFCASSPEGLGLALKVEDGAFRAILPALASVLGRLGVPAALPPSPVENAHGEVVGELRVA